MWPKEKLLIMSNFTFGHKVFKKSSGSITSKCISKWERVNVGIYYSWTRYLVCPTHSLIYCEKRRQRILNFSGPDKKGYTAFPPTISILLYNQTLWCGYQKKKESIILSTHIIGLYGQIRILEHAKRPLSRDICLNSFCAKGNIEVFANNTDSGESARNELSHLKSALFAF